MSVFKAYDIRGIAGTELDSDFAERLGGAIATHLDARRVSVVRDIRDSSPEYHEAFVRVFYLQEQMCLTWAFPLRAYYIVRR